jgi:hypothetical protein
LDRLFADSFAGDEHVVTIAFMVTLGDETLHGGLLHEDEKGIAGHLWLLTGDG